MTSILLTVLLMLVGFVGIIFIVLGLREEDYIRFWIGVIMLMVVLITTLFI